MKIYISITDHCIKQIKARNENCENDKKAENFGRNVFRKFILDGKFDKKDVKYLYSRDGKYKISNGEHQFIFTKPYKIEYVLITYVKRTLATENYFNKMRSYKKH